MPFAYYAKLSPARQRIYRRSDAIETPRCLPARGRARSSRASARASPATRSRRVQHACQALVDALVAGYRVPPIRLRVLAKRPSDDYGELHGLYEPDEGSTPARITVWMRTAAKKQVVAFKTFLRTLVHEVGHHLDYELFKLEETFHTEGFYKRESALANALLAQEAALADRSDARRTREAASGRGLRERRRAPAAAQRLDQAHARGQTAAENPERGPLAVQRSGLQHDNGEIARRAGLVLVGRDRDGFARGLDRLVLDRSLALEDRERGEVVLDFLEAREHGRAVDRDGLVPDGDRLLLLRLPQPGVEDDCETSAGPSAQ